MTRKYLIHTLLGLTLLLAACSGQPGLATCEVPDPGLAAAINAATGQPEGDPVGCLDLDGLTKLAAVRLDIRDLSGLPHRRPRNAIDVTSWCPAVSYSRLPAVTTALVTRSGTSHVVPRDTHIPTFRTIRAIASLSPTSSVRTDKLVTLSAQNATT